MTDRLSETVRRLVRFAIDIDGPRDLYGYTLQLCEENDRFRTERDEAVALLRELEWVDDGDIGTNDLAWCPWCGGGRDYGHAPDCRLDAFLKRVTP